MSDTPPVSRPDRTNRAALLVVVAALAIAWFTGSWWWYTCHIKNLCGTPGTVVSTTTASTTATGEVQKPGNCPNYLTAPIIADATNDRMNVEALQKFLNRTEKARLNIDGKYSAKVIAAVKRYQTKYKKTLLTPFGLTSPTGNVDGATLMKINATFCGVTPTYVKG